MAEKNLLLMVQLSCDQEHLGPFTLWYNSHLPNLLRIPGYQWAQRYVNLDEDARFTALYGVLDSADEDLVNLSLSAVSRLAAPDGVLIQSPVAHFPIIEYPLHLQEGMLHLGPHRRLLRRPPPHRSRVSGVFRVSSPPASPPDAPGFPPALHSLIPGVAPHHRHPTAAAEFAVWSHHARWPPSCSTKPVTESTPMCNFIPPGDHDVWSPPEFQVGVDLLEQMSEVQDGCLVASDPQTA